MRREILMKGSYYTKKSKAEFHPIGELLKRQSKGHFLTPEEKQRVKKHAQNRRTKR